ncbi:GNAT family N-acetyltransferase [Cognatiyoonia sp. IB215182]|uniref:GNAT family N-acetyltransferase n=1 Tax=Cognatiyoonia sp. IB215182 TaxID=3097353 RepID=UPI002A0D998C|nr:GNAT family N-acyltransferase [Cognatiyoonia sp. IB215182]MDX8352127.1 GNAT family N-acyltransferase [Cognatiyoonia sp. IB215182]
MTIALRKGAYVVRLADGPADMAACQQMRHVCFCGGTGVDADRFDHLSHHIMVEDLGGSLTATLRVAIWPDGRAMLGGYAAQFYDLSRLAAARGPFAEIGRFCIDPAVRDADVLRVIWGALARIVDAEDVRYLIGCTSFAGLDPAPYQAALALLGRRHVAPGHLRPALKAGEVTHFATGPSDMKSALRQMPALLRSYLMMGGWVSDHAVVDRDLQTLHVFTCVPVATIPAARAKALRAVAG